MFRSITSRQKLLLVVYAALLALIPLFAFVNSGEQATLIYCCFLFPVIGFFFGLYFGAVLHPILSCGLLLLNWIVMSAAIGQPFHLLSMLNNAPLLLAPSAGCFFGLVLYGITALSRWYSARMDAPEK